jgi:hypothetical protein
MDLGCRKEMHGRRNKRRAEEKRDIDASGESPKP